jgi:selenocysteine lyase/cysteine desulfurase
VPRLDPAPDDAPERLETGTQNHEGIVGAGAAVDWLAAIGGATRDSGVAKREALALAYAELHARSVALFRRLWDGLGDIRHARRFGLPPDQSRTPTLAFRVDGMTSDDVAVAFAERGLFVSHGDFYAATVIERLGVGPDGVVRVGCSAYTNDEEIDRVIEAVAELRSR